MSFKKFSVKQTETEKDKPAVQVEEAHDKASAAEKKESGAAPVRKP